MKIVSTLQSHGRHHLADTAKQLDLSPPAVMEQVKELEARTIKDYAGILGVKKATKDTTPLIDVSISQRRYREGFSAHMAKG